MTKDNMKLWDAVFKTDPDNTKEANVRGNQLTSVAPQTQIMAATELWGPYGGKWGWKSFEYDFTLVAGTGLLIFKGVMYYPGGEFPINSSISIYRDNGRTKPDQDFAKKVETDALTKGLSKLGFNADIFMGCFDDVKYVEERKAEVRKENGEIEPQDTQKPENKIPPWKGPLGKKVLTQSLTCLVDEMKKLTGKDTLGFLDGLWTDYKAILEQAETDVPKWYGNTLAVKKETEIMIGKFPEGNDPFDTESLNDEIPF